MNLLLAIALTVTPSDALADAPLKMAARRANSAAVIRAYAEDAAKVKWQSSSPLPADSNMLIKSMTAAPNARFNTAGLEHFSVRFELEVDGKVVSTATVERRFRGEGVTRRDVRDGTLIGTLFTPRGTPRGRVLVIGGSEGGIGDEETAALLASHGFKTFAMAYFGVDPLPSALADIPLESFARAVDYLGGDVSILATSKGAEAALVFSAGRRDVKKIVAYAPSSVVWSCICDRPTSSWSRDGKPVRFVPAGNDPSYKPVPPLEPAVNYRYRLRTAPHEAQIDVASIHAPLLLIAGADDRLSPSAEMARDIIDRRRRKDDQLLILEGAGHLIPKAIVPAGSTRIANGRIETGGSTAANAAAQAISWPAVLRFLGRRGGRCAHHGGQPMYP